MQTLQGPGGGNTPTTLDKILKWVIPIGLVYGGIVGYNKWLAPNINAFVDNTPHLIAFIAICTVIGLGAAYIITNPMLIYMQVKNLFSYMTRWMIKQDPLSFMDRYIDILEDKRAGLQKSKEALNAQAISLKRRLDVLHDSFNDFMKRASAADNQKDKAHYASMAQTNKDSAGHLQPLYTKITSSYSFLNDLYDNWGRSIEKLKETVRVKRDEYEACKETAKAMGMAEEFTKGDTEEGKLFKMSTDALEKNVTQKMAFIQDFMESSKDVMKGIDLEKKMDENDGLQLLEQYQNNKNLFLPEDNWIDAVVVTPTAIPMSSSKKGTNSEASSLIEL